LIASLSIGPTTCQIESRLIHFKRFRCARIILCGIEVMHMIHKGQMKDKGDDWTFADQFYSLAT
jgi:putative transposase